MNSEMTTIAAPVDRLVLQLTEDSDQKFQAGLIKRIALALDCPGGDTVPKRNAAIMSLVLVAASAMKVTYYGHVPEKQLPGALIDDVAAEALTAMFEAMDRFVSLSSSEAVDSGSEQAGSAENFTKDE